MVVYKLIGRTAPLDWASMAEDVELGLYRTLEGAKAAKAKMEARKDFYMDWKELFINTADLLD